MFYTYGQNNSGGSFDHDPMAGIGYNVCVEADSADEANAKAETIGLYFDGRGDCPCCGDRWYDVTDSDGEDTPQKWGQPLTGGWGIPSYIHYKNGTVTSVDSDGVEH